MSKTAVLKLKPRARINYNYATGDLNYAEYSGGVLRANYTETVHGTYNQITYTYNLDMRTMSETAGREALPDTAAVTQLTFTVPNSGSQTINVYAYAGPNTIQGWYAFWELMQGTAETLLGTAAGNTSTTITVTDPANIQRIMRTGGGVTFTVPQVYNGYMLWTSLPVIEMTVTYDNTAAAPTIAITEPSDLSNRVTDETLTVSWDYAQDDGAAQASYTIQASYDDGATWETAASETSAAHTHTFPADTFHTGTLRLRVIASSAYADSDPAEVRVLMRANPATSDVSCDGNPHPTVSWTGADQTAYQVRFGDWDSGTKYGSASSMTIPRIFAAGVYPVTVRTQTSNGDWSAWSNTLWVEITNSDPGLTSSLTVAMSGGAALVSWTESQGAAGYVLLRDGEPVYAGTALYYRDDAAAGTVTWTLRCVSAAGYYSDADTLTYTLPLRCDMLRPMDDDTADWIAIRYSLDRRSRSYDRQLGTSFRYYAGREKPVAVSTGESTRTMRTTAAFKSRTQAEAILALAGRPVIYKDITGGVIIGILNPAGYDAERVFSVDLSITEIDWPADIDSGVEAIFTAAATHIRAIDPVTETRVKCTINSSGNWASPTTSSIAWMLEVPEGSTHLRIHTGRSGNIMAWLTSGTVKTSGKPDYCEGYSNRITIGSSTPQPMELPADCTFVYVAIRYSSGWTIPKMAQFEGSYV